MKVMVFAAHPDDEVLGCGATIARHARAGDEVRIHILGEGMTSRWEDSDAGDRERVDDLRDHAMKAGKLLGASQVIMHDLPDNRFDSVPLLEIVKRIEAPLFEFEPDLVYSHSNADLNIDHTLLHRAVLTATRPTSASSPAEVLAFEVPSSTEWTFQSLGVPFRPTVFVDVTETLRSKLDAMACYASESREFPHPRSPEAIEAISKVRGSAAGVAHAEAFELVRSVRRFPG